MTVTDQPALTPVPVIETSTTDAAAADTNPLIDLIDPRRWLETAGGRTIPILVAMGIIWLYFELATGGLFFTPGNISNILIYSSEYGIVAIGVVVVLLLGEIDLSLGSLVGASGAAAGAAMFEPINWSLFGINIHFDFIQTAPAIPQLFLAIGVSILVGVLSGAIVGFFVAIIRIPSFVVTLAGLLLLYGLALVITNAQTLTITNDYYNALGSSSFQALDRGYLPTIVGTGSDPFHISVGMIAALVAGLAYTLILLLGVSRRRRTGLSARPPAWAVAQGLAITVAGVAISWLLDRQQGVPIPFFIMMIFLVVFSYIARKTKFGRHIYATGGNAEAARRAGIAIRRVRWSAFIISGFCAGVVGVIFMAKSNSVNGGTPTPDFLLLAIAAAVIGGTSLFGGRGSVWAALTGAVMLASVQTGMQLTLSSNTNSEYYQWIVQALILLGAVWLDTYARGRSTADRRT